MTPSQTKLRKKSAPRRSAKSGRSAAVGRLRIDAGTAGSAAVPPAAVSPDVAALRVRSEQIAAERDAAAAAIELIAAVGRADDARAALHELVDGLRRVTGAETVVAGWVRKSRCEPRAVSGRPVLKRHTDAARRFRAALEETVLRPEPSRWPLADGDDAGGAVPLSLRGLADGEGAAVVLGVPLIGSRPSSGTPGEEPIAAVVLAGAPGSSLPACSSA
ncbi:hypothetical protein, partial [Alienimonas chondri]|uniref:hypothetical protein n=1 Tax=Alienimonas chondri TaxID=2681879 RepID=UPI0014881FCA